MRGSGAIEFKVDRKPAGYGGRTFSFEDRC
jgi:hypothetical protein